jgi:hypothetical protein
MPGSPNFAVELESFQSQGRVRTPISFWADLVFEDGSRKPQTVHVTDWWDDVQGEYDHAWGYPYE